ncbi:MAG: peptidase M15 [Planctomycetota bacterium]|nr:MAG: peptidase M15 [Planctomycetota bacterium]
MAPLSPTASRAPRPGALLCLVAALTMCASLRPQGIEGVLARPSLRGLTVAVAVADAETGERLFGRNIDRPMVPASNLKLLTTAGAIAELGADWRFTTRLLGTAPLDADGILHGDLVLWGSGDPSMRRDVFDAVGLPDPAVHLARLAQRAGLRRVDGALLLDEAYLDREVLHPDWEPSDLTNDYAAPISALSIHANCLDLLVDGNRGSTSPALRIETLVDGYQLRNEVDFAPRPNVLSVGALRPDAGSRVTVRGRISRGERFPFRVPVVDPPLFFGRCLSAALRQADIPVEGGVQRESGAASLHPGAEVLAEHLASLEWPVTLANKQSDNSMADHLFKVLGAERGDRGSFAGGERAMLSFLRDRVGTSTDGIVLRDGSGLSAKNRITTRVMVDTLVAMQLTNEAERGMFLRSLPVSGVDGSLEQRLSEAPYRGAVRAKTGWITGASALSGFVHTATGRVLAFSVLINGLRPGQNKAMKAVQDDLCRALYDNW